MLNRAAQWLKKYLPSWVVICLLLAGACTSRPTAHRAHGTATVAALTSSFVQIMSVAYGIPVDCENVDTGELSECEEGENVEPLISTFIGSGVIVDRTGQNTHVLTAHHVCNLSGLPNMGSFSAMQGRAEIYTKISWTISHAAVDIEGTPHIARPIIFDATNDLCVMATDGVWGSQVTLSPWAPEVGDEVYNIAAPMGIFDVHMVPIFHGIYSGMTRSLMGSGITSEIHTYTFPSRPGSSGSPIFDTAGRLIGILHSTMPQFWNISMGASWGATRDIIGQISDRPR
jgi:S1-C subfamily serine protease